jgi:small-conductance mechanosensitive channel
MNEKMTTLRSAKISAAVFAALLASTLLALWLTREPSTTRQAPFTRGTVDRRMYDTARQSAALAETPAEQDLAREAVRLADHELDQALAGALRDAAAFRPPPGGPLAKLRARLDQAKKNVAADQQRIGRLSKDNPDQIEVAKAQLALDEDELEDAQADLAREGGDPKTAVERAMAEHEASQQNSALPKPPQPAPTDTLAEQFTAWRVLGDREAQIEKYREQAVACSAGLTREHQSLEALIAQKPLPAPAPDAGTDADTEVEDPAAMLERLRGLSDQRKSLTELDRRIQDCKEIADTYKSWIGLIEAHRRTVWRQLLGSLAMVFGVLLLAVVIETAGRRAVHQPKDRHRAHQQRFLVSLAVRLAAILAIGLILFGPPSQLSTVIGLATAGLTVVLKDFVVAFIGWFVLMGRNGVRIGDWVEINGVSGEVIEIGLFKTSLLEMGTGHPTGRRVSFMNGYAFEGQWFNFSTAGQWLWDELQVSIPAGIDPYTTAQRIREVVERETEENVQLAEQDWERITQQYGTRPFSAKPTINLRPGLQGLEVQVRYITRGPERYEVKSRLFKEIIELMRK